jgi:signal transduction histidine kinase
MVAPPTAEDEPSSAWSAFWSGVPRSEALVIVVRTVLIVLSLLIVAVSGSAGRLWPSWALLALMAVLFTWLGPRLKYSPPAAMVEALLTVLIATWLDPVGPLILYLMAPGLASGLRGGYRWALGCTAIPAVVAALIVLQRQSDLLVPSLISIAQWGILSSAVGLLGSWVAAQRPEASDATLRSYGEAVRLLTQLEPVSRRLSEGLDAGTIGLGLLRALAREIDADQCVVVAREPSGGFVVIAGLPDSRAEWVPDGARLEEMVTVIEGDISEQGDLGPLLVLPMRVADRLIGFVLVLNASAVDADHSARVKNLLEGSAIAMQAALLFDRIRYMAANEERDRIAREIHDGIAQDVAFLGYAADEIIACSTDVATRERAEELRREITRVVGELRRSVYDLRSASPTSGTLGGALAGFARKMFGDLDIDLHVVIDEAPERLRPMIEAELLRIGQEAITNVRKHADATNVWVECRVAAPNAVVVVEDDGRGISGRRDDSFGLDIMLERAAHIRADLAVRERPGGGTSVSVRL